MEVPTMFETIILIWLSLLTAPFLLLACLLARPHSLICPLCENVGVVEQDGSLKPCPECSLRSTTYRANDVIVTH
jgi:hypothetical protein